MRAGAWTGRETRGRGPVIRSRCLAGGARRVSHPETVRPSRCTSSGPGIHRERPPFLGSGRVGLGGYCTATARAGRSSSKSNHQKGVAVTGDLRLFGLPPILSATDLYRTIMKKCARRISAESELHAQLCSFFFFSLLLLCFVVAARRQHSKMFGENR